MRFRHGDTFAKTTRKCLDQPNNLSLDFWVHRSMGHVPEEFLGPGGFAGKPCHALISFTRCVVSVAADLWRIIKIIFPSNYCLPHQFSTWSRVTWTRVSFYYRSSQCAIYSWRIYQLYIVSRAGDQIVILFLSDIMYISVLDCYAYFSTTRNACTCILDVHVWISYSNKVEAIFPPFASSCFFFHYRGGHYCAYWCTILHVHVHELCFATWSPMQT